MEEKNTRILYAVMVGINQYPQRPLAGCIRDVLGVDRMLRDLAGQQPGGLVYKPLYLLAPRPADLAAIDAYQAASGMTWLYSAPTFAQVSKGFTHFHGACENDICVFYFSGHGSYLDAPRELWGSKPDRKMESLVCVDSRMPGGRDLLDVEVGYLLWRAMHKKQHLHSLVIIDSCHAGGVTRGATFDTPAQHRYEPPPAQKLPVENYLGYAQGFYQQVDGALKIPVARYVQLSACRDDELAQETVEGGLFTRKLLALLRDGAGKSYRELMRALAVSVIQVSGQTPVAFAREAGDLDLVFLGSGIKPFVPAYLVRYDQTTARWMLYAGQLHGLSSGTAVAPRVRVVVARETAVLAFVDRVSSLTSTLRTVDMHGLDTANEYMATIIALGDPSLVAGVSKTLQLDATRLTALQAAYAAVAPAYVQLDFSDMARAEYIVQLTHDNQYVLTRSGSDMPLFRREATATGFLLAADQVGAWLNARALHNPTARYSPDDFEFIVEVLEGPAAAVGEKGVLATVNPYQETTLRYVGDQQPRFRFSIALKASSAWASCYVAAIVLGSRFGIDTDFLGESGVLLTRGGEAAFLQYIHPQTKLTRQDLPASLPQAYRQLGVQEIVDYVKIFVASQPVSLEPLRQVPLQIDIPTTLQRDIAEDGEIVARLPVDWAAFTFPLRVVGPQTTKVLVVGENQFDGFSVTAPPAMQAAVSVITRPEWTETPRQADAIGRVPAMPLVPGPELWGDVMTSDQWLSGLGPQGKDLAALELFAVDGEMAPVLALGEEMVIAPYAKLGQVRGEAGLESMIVPFGYDEVAGLYFPVGYSDDVGRVHVQQLPPPTAGTFQGGGAAARSLGGSVKLFFRKIFRRKQNHNALVLFRVGAGCTWVRLTDDPAAMHDHIPANNSKPVLLLIHGIIGDTVYMVESMKAVNDLHKTVDFVLTYDYENLSTPNAKTAAMLNANLRSAGFDGVSARRLYIIAHSMGGLVSRAVIHQHAGYEYISRLLMVGVPNGGSELSTVAQSVTGLLVHALNVTGPIKYALQGLCFVLKKIHLNPTATFQELAPDSAFITDMRATPLNYGVRVSILGGDVALLKKHYAGDDFFLRRLGEALEKDFLYPGLRLAVFGGKLHDMAVTLDSMRDIVNATDIIENITLACNHISYFQDESCRNELMKMLRR